MNSMREKWAEEIKNCTTKNWPENAHHDHYSTELGWEFLGKDDKCDYYVSHKHKFLSIVYGSEDWEYISPDYNILMTGGARGMICEVMQEYPYSKLRALIEESSNE